VLQNLFSAWRTIWELRVETERTTMKDDLDDIPMTYLLYVLLAIAAIVAAAAIVITRMF
jgi:hypothetical protein